jgi:site-specific DNA-methyltransferase (adenine-specific)
VKTIPRNTIIQGDARQVLRDFPTESVDSILMSPPYATGARDYKHAQQLGREPTIAAYVENLAKVLAETRRVLKPTGSLFIVLGDRFARSPRQGAPKGSLLLTSQRVALSLLALGYTMRGQVVWQKPDPKPESATNRFSQAYELILFATKDSRGYFMDIDALREPPRSADRVGVRRPREGSRRYQAGNSGLAQMKADGRVAHPNGRSPRDVWTIPTARDRTGTHAAAFPLELARRIVTAATPEKICTRCQEPWVRPARIVSRKTKAGMRHTRNVGTLRRQCECDPRGTTRGIVLDPFMGTGTTAVAARSLGRDFVGIELNPQYIELANQRIAAARRKP